MSATPCFRMGCQSRTTLHGRSLTAFPTLFPQILSRPRSVHVPPFLPSHRYSTCQISFFLCLLSLVRPCVCWQLTLYLLDNTNADIETRSYWVKIAHEFNVPIRCVRFTASTRLAEHNDAVRALNPNTVRISSSARNQLGSGDVLYSL